MSAISENFGVLRWFNAYLVSLIAITVPAFIAFYLLFATRTRKRLRLPPVSPASALSNLIIKVRQAGLGRFTHYTEQRDIIKARFPEFQHGTAFRMNYIPFISSDFIYITDYQLARKVLLGDPESGAHEAIKKNMISSFNLADRKIPNIFTASSTDPHREKNRKFIAPAFSMTNLAHTTPCLNRNIDNAFQVVFQKYADKDEVVDLKPIVLALLMETLTESAFGMKFRCSVLGSESERQAVVHAGVINDNATSETDTKQETTIDGDEFLHELDIVLRERTVQAIVPLRKYMFWSKGVQRSADACAKLARIAKLVLNDYRASHPKGVLVDSEHNGNMSIISRLLQHDYPSDDYRVSELLVLIVAGHETTAYSLCFLLAEVARHPEVQRRLQQELDVLITSDSCANGRPSPSLLSKAEYLQWCIFESMRLWPVAGTGSARTMQSELEYKGYVIPKGHLVMTSFFLMFRETWIDRPDEFLPERWNPQNPQYAALREMLMPFSLGKRGCVGQNMAKMQMKLLAANMFRYFEFELAEELKYEVFLTIKMESLKMKLKQRK